MAVAAALTRITLGNLSLYVVSLRQGQQAFQSVLSGIGNLYEHNLYMSNLFSYIELAEASELAQGERASARSIQSVSSAQLRAAKPASVSRTWAFAIRARTSWALRHIDLTIAPGDSIALVGENGAGKTTFVKLLAGLSSPVKGASCSMGAIYRLGSRNSCVSASAYCSKTSTSTSSSCARTSAGQRGSLDGRSAPRTRSRARRGERAIANATRRSRRGARTLVRKGQRACPAVNGKRSPWRAPSCAKRPTSWCSMSPPRPSTQNPNTPCSNAFENSPSAGPRS